MTIVVYFENNTGMHLKLRRNMKDFTQGAWYRPRLEPDTFRT